MERKAKIASLYRGQRPHKFKDSDLIFQALFWEKEDQDVEDEDEDGDKEDEYNYSAFNEDDNGFGYETQEKKYKEKRLVLRTYGLTKDGTSVCLEITGFQPYFLLKLPPEWGKSRIKTLQSRISTMVGYRKKELLFSTVRMKKLYYFDNYKDHSFLKISFKTDSARWETMKALIPKEKENISPHVIKFQETNPINIGGIKVKLHVYESTMDTIIRFIHISGIKPSGIIKIDKQNLKRTVTKSTCQITKSTNWKNVCPVDEDWIAPFRVSSYDIECTSKDGSFPQADRKEDKVIQIGTTTRIYGEKYCRIRHIVTLKNSNDIPDVKHKKHPDELVIVESVKTERELLTLWAKHICALDPDVMIGYNIFGFDWKYIYDRAKKLRCEKHVSRIGRLAGKECKLKDQRLSSSSMGHNFLHYPLINGRVQIDLLPVIRNSYNLNSYKLDNVAKHFLGLQKNDLPPDQIFARYNAGGSEDIKVIAEYCLQDCLLVNNLFDKLDVFVNSIGMSNVCLVPISLLFTRGQGIKVFSKIGEKCLQRNTAFPTLVKIEHQKDGKKEVGYEGAIVLEPKPGFYDDPIAVLDYGSLYPSTMIEHNISYETYVQEDLNKEGESRKHDKMEFDLFDGETKETDNCRYNSIYIREYGGMFDKTCVYAEPLLEKPKDEHDKKMMPNLKGKGIIPSLLQDLLTARKAAKKQMAATTDPFKKAVYNGKQLALKVTANSVYGYTGAKFSDLRFIDLAASTTAGGREKIYVAKDFAEKKYLGTVVVYGDSVAPDTPLLLRKENGDITIRSINQLVSNWGNCPIDDTGKQHSETDEKFEVWTDQGWSKVQNVMKHKVCKKMYRVLTHTGLVDVTEDHSLLNKDGQEVTPNQVNIGSELLHSFPEDNFKENEVINKDLAFVYGFFFAEGSAGCYDTKWGAKNTWGIVNQDLTPLEKCQNILKEHGIETKILDCRDSSAVHKLVPVGKIKPMAVEYHKKFYCHDRYKKVPDIILNGTNEVIQGFMDGYYEGDGDKGSIMRCDCKGQIGAMGLFYIIRRLGYHASINCRKDKPNVFRVTGTKSYQRKSPIKIKKLFELPNDRCTEVYDLTTENHHFHAGVGQLIVHNTDSIFINPCQHPSLKGLKGKELLAATIKLGEEMANYITSQLRKPQVLEYEKTFWPYMIITKKRYAGNKYEFSPDKYKFTSMGLVTKRRDNAPILKRIYKGVLDIMFGQDESSVAVKKAVKLYREGATDLLKGNVDLKDLVVSKTLKTGYKNPTTITHKVLAEKITDRDPGNAPSCNERIPYVFIDAKEITCHACKKKVNIEKCKCKICMYLYCSTHLRRHKDTCVPRCRMCWTKKNVSCCGVCGGGYCTKHKIDHKCSNINEKALQGDLAETPSYIKENNIKVDYRYYLDHQIRKPVSQIFELIKETKGVDPLKQIIIKDNNRKNGIRNITDFFK